MTIECIRYRILTQWGVIFTDFANTLSVDNIHNLAYVDQLSKKRSALAAIVAVRGK